MKKVVIPFLFILGIGVIAVLMLSKPTDREELPLINIGLDNTIDNLSEDLRERLLDMDKDTADEIFSFLKDKAHNGELGSNGDVDAVLKEAEDKYGFTLDDESKGQIEEAIDTLEGMGFSTETIVEKTEDLYDEYGNDFVDHMGEAFVESAKDAAGNAAQNAWDKATESVKDVFRKVVSD